MTSMSRPFTLLPALTFTPLSSASSHLSRQHNGVWGHLTLQRGLKRDRGRVRVTLLEKNRLGEQYEEITVRKGLARNILIKRRQAAYTSSLPSDPSPPPPPSPSHSSSLSLSDGDATRELIQRGEQQEIGKSGLVKKYKRHVALPYALRISELQKKQAETEKSADIAALARKQWIKNVAMQLSNLKLDFQRAPAPFLRGEQEMVDANDVRESLGRVGGTAINSVMVYRRLMDRYRIYNVDPYDMDLGPKAQLLTRTTASNEVKASSNADVDIMQPNILPITDRDSLPRIERFGEHHVTVSLNLCDETGKWGKEKVVVRVMVRPTDDSDPELIEERARNKAAQSVDDDDNISEKSSSGDVRANKTKKKKKQLT